MHAIDSQNMLTKSVYSHNNFTAHSLIHYCAYKYEECEKEAEKR